MKTSVIWLLVLTCVMGVTAQEFTSATAKLAQENYKKALAQVDKAYATALQGALRQAQFNKDDAETERIKDVLKTITGDQPQGDNTSAQGAPRLSFKTVKVPANKATGWVLGKVSKGDKISIQYVSGMWSHHWANPILTSPDSSDKVACVICIKQSDEYGVLAKIPTNTKEQPFEYTFDNAYESVILKCPWGPESVGEAVYKIAVTKAR
jgi:hypothetical protein